MLCILKGVAVKVAGEVAKPGEVAVEVAVIQIDATRGQALSPNPLFLLVEMNGIEPSTYALRTHNFAIFQMFQNVSA